MFTMRKTLITIAAAGASLLTGCTSGQFGPGCYVQDGTYSVRYVEVSRTGTCSATQARVAESVGVFKYREPNSEGGTVAFRPSRAAAVATTNAERDAGYPQNAAATGLGTLTGEATGEGTEQYCAVTNVTPVSVTSATNQVTQYTFENMRIYNGPRSLGTQFNGRVTFTQNTPASGSTPASSCTIVADAFGSWPAITCDTTLPVMGEDDESTLDVDEAALSCGAGSLMNQDIQWQCLADLIIDPTGHTGRCVTSKPTPSYKDGIEELEYRER